MRLVVWCRDKEGATPLDLHNNPSWEGRFIRTCAVDVHPAVGENVDLAQAEDMDDTHEVLYVCHKVLRREVYVEIPWFEPEEEEETQ